MFQSILVLFFCFFCCDCKIAGGVILYDRRINQMEFFFINWYLNPNKVHSM